MDGSGALPSLSHEHEAIASLIRKTEDVCARDIGVYGHHLETWSVFVDDEEQARRPFVVSGHGDRISNDESTWQASLWRRGQCSAPLTSFTRDMRGPVTRVLLSRDAQHVATSSQCVCVWDVEAHTQTQDAVWRSEDKVRLCGRGFAASSDSLLLLRENAFQCVSTRTQQLQWSCDSIAGVRDVCAVSDHVVAVFCRDTALEFHDTRKLGSSVCSFHLDEGKYGARTCISDGRNVFFVSCIDYGSYGVHCVSADDAKQVWRVATNGGSDGWHTALCGGAKALVVSSVSDHLSALDAKTGQWIVKANYDGYHSWFFATAASTHTIAVGGACGHVALQAKLAVVEEDGYDYNSKKNPKKETTCVIS